jgi:hypothetical protein
MSDDTYDLDDEDILAVDDPVACRALAFTKLAVALEEISDEEIKKEGLSMLKVLRLSIKAPKGELRVIDGSGGSPST